MTTLAEIQAAIQELSDTEAHQLAVWLQGYVDDLWDQQMEADAVAGKFDRLITEVEADISANRVRDLNEILHNS